ncbi:MAG: hypothetical protein HYW24_03355 [Candidatus Aenigmarchaeota archaeon]|nr:hypothetical protein [Candidatus Aenigmarchaeota archaeon]
MSYEIGRRALGYVGSHAIRLAGQAGAAGVLFGDGNGYLGKVKDGILTAPNFIYNVPHIIKDLDKVRRIDTGIEKAGAETGNALDYLKHLQLREAYEALTRGAEGAKQVYDVVREIDYNSIWHAGVNLANNVLDKPVETAAAAGTMLALGYVGGRAARFWAKRGGESFYETWERNLGRKLFRGYFDKHPERELLYRSEIEDRDSRTGIQ